MSESATSPKVGDSFLRCHYPWKDTDAEHALLAHQWATDGDSLPCPIDLEGAQERFEVEEFVTLEDGSSAQDQYWRWIWEEVDAWFNGQPDDLLANRQAYASALHKAFPMPPNT